MRYNRSLWLGESVTCFTPEGVLTDELLMSVYKCLWKCQTNMSCWLFCHALAQASSQCNFVHKYSCHIHFDHIAKRLRLH